MTTLRGTAGLASLLADIAATPNNLAGALAGASDESLDAAREGEWSARTVVAHLRDDEFMVMRLRLARMLVEDAPALAPFDEKAWAASRYTGRDAIGELLADFKVQREASVSILRRLQPDDLLRTGRQPEIGTFDIHYWLQHWVEHDHTHLAQVRDALSAA